MKQDIVKYIREKFIENLDEGLLLSFDNDYDKIVSGNLDISSDDFKEKNLSDLLHNVYAAKTSFYADDSNNYCQFFKSNNKTLPEKRYIFPYLAVKFAKMQTNDSYYYTTPPSPFYFFRDKDYRGNFFNEFSTHWKDRLSSLKLILEKIPEIINAETINTNDLIFTNIGYRRYGYSGLGSYHPKLFDVIYILDNNQNYRLVKQSDCKGINETFADIFVISTKYFIKLSIGQKGVIDRIQQIIQRDIKKLNIAENNMVEVFFHGHYDPETIVLDDYKSALKLQQHLTELRQMRTNNDNKNKQNRK